jgi:hypothetical protein
LSLLASSLSPSTNSLLSFSSSCVTYVTMSTIWSSCKLCSVHCLHVMLQPIKCTHMGAAIHDAHCPDPVGRLRHQLGFKK